MSQNPVSASIALRQNVLPINSRTCDDNARPYTARLTTAFYRITTSKSSHDLSNRRIRTQFNIYGTNWIAVFAIFASQSIRITNKQQSIIWCYWYILAYAQRIWHTVSVLCDSILSMAGALDCSPNCMPFHSWMFTPRRTVHTEFLHCTGLYILNISPVPDCIYTECFPRTGLPRTCLCILDISSVPNCTYRMH